jgi:hypothetical protein
MAARHVFSHPGGLSRLGDIGEAHFEVRLGRQSRDCPEPRRRRAFTRVEAGEWVYGPRVGSSSAPRPVHALDTLGLHRLCNCSRRWIHHSWALARDGSLMDRLGLALQAGVFGFLRFRPPKRERGGPEQNQRHGHDGRSGSRGPLRPDVGADAMRGRGARGHRLDRRSQDSSRAIPVPDRATGATPSFPVPTRSRASVQQRSQGRS